MDFITVDAIWIGIFTTIGVYYAATVAYKDVDTFTTIAMLAMSMLAFGAAAKQALGAVAQVVAGG